MTSKHIPYLVELGFAALVCVACENRISTTPVGPDGSATAFDEAQSGGGTGGAGGLGGAGGMNGTGGISGTSGTGGTAGTGGNAGTGGTGGVGGTDGGSADPLRTGDPSHDAYDAAILDSAARYGWPDAMMTKSMVAQESDFDPSATSPDSPCGIPTGWTDAESKSFGLIQVTPACGEAMRMRLPSGHPNMTRDTSALAFASSVFNPTLSIDEGVRLSKVLLDEMKSKFAGCTAEAYILMAIGAYNSGSGAVTGCNTLNARASNYVSNVLAHYRTFAGEAGLPVPY